MLARVPPFANPAWNAALLWAASCAWFPATAGEKSTTGNVEASLQRRITQQLVGDSARERIREQPKATPNDRILKAKGRPSEAKARQPLDRRVVGQDLVLARDNRLVVRLVYVVRDIEEVSTQPGKTIRLAYWIREVLTSQREGQF